jgi:hypothetical protein
VVDLDVRVVLVYAPVTQGGMNHLGLDAQALHQDGTLRDLLMHRVPVIRVAGKAPGSLDQVSFECHGQAQLDAKLVGVAAFAFGDAFHLWRMPAVEFDVVVHCLATARL